MLACMVCVRMLVWCVCVCSHVVCTMGGGSAALDVRARAKTQAHRALVLRGEGRVHKSSQVKRAHLHVLCHGVRVRDGLSEHLIRHDAPRIYVARTGVRRAAHRAQQLGRHVWQRADLTRRTRRHTAHARARTWEEPRGWSFSFSQGPSPVAPRAAVLACVRVLATLAPLFVMARRRCALGGWCAPRTA
jgi:hypothetical protein